MSAAITVRGARTHNHRSTVGTVTELHAYLRLLFARCGSRPELPSLHAPLLVTVR